MSIWFNGSIHLLAGGTSGAREYRQVPARTEYLIPPEWFFLSACKRFDVRPCALGAIMYARKAFQEDDQWRQSKPETG